MNKYPHVSLLLPSFLFVLTAESTKQHKQMMIIISFVSDSEAVLYFILHSKCVFFGLFHCVCNQRKQAPRQFFYSVQQ